ncbi:MAG: glycine--tRNA ligase subunit beta, partial [Pseudomonadota bacterium]
QKRLSELSLGYDEFVPYATPRRLAFLIRGLVERQADQAVTRKGPPVKIAFDADGNPTKAAEKFIEGCGVPLDQIGRQKTDKGEWLYYEGTQPGEATAALLPDVIAGALAALPIPKRMRWGSRTEEFVRPVHWSVLLFGDERIDASFIGASTGTATRGHRFHAPGELSLTNPAAYAEALQDNGHVMAHFATRRERIEALIKQTADELGGTAIADDDLLDEVTALVEWPVPVAGRFDQAFLALPEEVLISTLKDHQRYFALRGADGKLLPWFITLSNIDSANPDAVRDGNERVVHPRLSDADFFYSLDRKRTLADRVDEMDAVLFQKDLGSLKAKVDRVVALAGRIAADLGDNALEATRAALLAKCDLQTEMVGEFPELQGIMGRYYATHDNEPADVALAIEEHYLPRFAGDALPTTGAGRAVSLADRIDTLTGIFGIGKPPSGTRDPFGLRRAALGVLRIVTETGADLDLRALVEHAAEQLPAIEPELDRKGKPKQAPPTGEVLVNQVMDYMTERLRGVAADQHGASGGQFDAVVSLNASRPADVIARVNAVRDFASTPAAESLIAANKRIANLLRQSGDVDTAIDTTLFDDPAEQALHGALATVSAGVANAVDKADYTAALDQLATLRDPVDTFFDDVLVMADDDAVKRNRLALLTALRAQFLKVADISLAAQ